MNTNTARTLTPASTRPRLHPGAARAASAQHGIRMDAFLVDYIRNHVNQLMVRVEMTSLIRRYFTPLAPYALADITPLMVESWFHEIGQHSQAQVNKSLSLLRTMFERARDWRLFSGENPAQRVKKYTKHARTRFVQPKEMPALMAALQRAREYIQCFFLLPLLVGCRRTEGLTLKWADFDFEGARGTSHGPKRVCRIRSPSRARCCSVSRRCRAPMTMSLRHRRGTCPGPRL